MIASQALKFDVGVSIQPTLNFSASTIWPAVNRVESEVERLEMADDALIAALKKLKGKSP